MKKNSRNVWILLSIVLVAALAIFLITRAKEPMTTNSEVIPKPSSGDRKKARQILAEPIRMDLPTKSVNISASAGTTTSDRDMSNLEIEQACEAEWQKFLGVKADEWLLQHWKRLSKLHPE